VAYFNQLVRGHAFENGNKRIAVLFTDFFLWSNFVEFTLSWQEMYHFAVLVAQAGEKNISFEETKKLCRKIIGEFTMDLPKR
jgi:death-on-curing family protein